MSAPHSHPAGATLDQFLLRLHGVGHLGGGQWSAQCPVADHDDMHASLSVLAGDKGIALHCHAGCSVQQVCDAVGWQVRDLFFNVVPLRRNGVVAFPSPRPLSQSPAGGTAGRPPRGEVSMPGEHVVQSWRERIVEVAARLFELKGWSLRTLQRLGVGFDGERVVFPMLDVDGRLVGLVRYKPGHTPKTLAVGSRELWPSPASMAVNDVLLVEGEPDRVSGEELGWETVSVPGVAKWRDDWAPLFVGKRVTVCFDCDPQGRQAAERRVRDLQAAGVQARMVDLDPARDDGFDLGDCLLLVRSEDRVGDLAAYLLRLQAEAWSA